MAPLPHPCSPSPKINNHHWELLHRRLLWAHQSVKNKEDSGKVITDAPPSGVWLVVRGACTVIQNGVQVHAEPNQWLFPMAGPREQYFAPDTEILSIGFLARWPNGVDLINNPKCQILQHPDCHALSLSSKNLVNCIHQILPPPCNWEQARNWRDQLTINSHFEIDGIFQIWLSSFLKIAEQAGASIEHMIGKDHRVHAIINQLEQKSGILEIDWNNIQNQTGLSRRRIDELFIAETGLTVSNFNYNLILQRTQRELQNPTNQIKEIAFKAGFDHTSSFSRWFRLKTGMSPSEFRATLASSDL